MQLYRAKIYLIILKFGAFETAKMAFHVKSKRQINQENSTLCSVITQYASHCNVLFSGSYNGRLVKYLHSNSENVLLPFNFVD